MSNGIPGTLTTTSFEVPYETAVEQEEADKFNEELAGTGFRTARFVRDFAFATANGEKTTLKSGDLVKVFKTVTDGDVLCSGTVKLEYGREIQTGPTGYKQQAMDGYWIHGLQKDMKPADWTCMFHEQRPAKLERDGKIIFGALDPYFETGTEGVIWSLQEFGKAGYDGLHCLRDGDKLTVYNTVRDGAVAWEGKVDFSAPQVTKAGWTEVARTANHMDTEKWLQLSWDRSPAILTPGP